MTTIGRYRSLDYVADYLGISKATVRRIVDAGEITAHRIGGQIRISDDEIERYVSGAVMDVTR